MFHQANMGENSVFNGYFRGWRIRHLKTIYSLFKPLLNLEPTKIVVKLTFVALELARMLLKLGGDQSLLLGGSLLCQLSFMVIWYKPTFLIDLWSLRVWGSHHAFEINARESQRETDRQMERRESVFTNQSFLTVTLLYGSFLSFWLTST